MLLAKPRFEPVQRPGRPRIRFRQRLRRFKTLFGLWGVQLIVASVFALEHRAPGNLDLVENPGAGKRPVYSANALQHWKRDIALGMFSAASRRAL